ncbi:MAG: hypothetical protein Q9225_005575 [Loekoesia sp. 1 TL-2023]
MSSSPLILVIGGNGFVGYAVLAGALKAGYQVRAAVRRQDAIDRISRAPSIQKYLSTGELTFVVVSDNTLPCAYNEAAKDCSYIFHMASPLASQPGDLVSQAIAGTKAVLVAAEATLSVKRVVFTASTSSVRPFERLLLTHPANQAIMAGKDDEVPALTAESRVPTQPPIPDDAPGFHRYINSKIAAMNLVDEYATTQEFNDAHFSIINIMPGWILGPEELARNKQEAFKGSNLMLAWLFADVSLAPFLGLPADEYAPLLSETVHLDDVVEAHVNALKTNKVPGKYRNFLLCSEAPTGPDLMSAVGIVRRELPQEVSDGKIPFAGKLGTIKSKLDVTSAERDLLGHPFQPYEKQVKDTIKWFVHLSD